MSNLFSENFPVARNNADLARLRAEYPNYDPYYIASGAIPERRILFEKLYEKFYPYKDDIFLSEIKKHFHQRTWEMYLTSVFLEEGFQVSSKNSGPDIKIQHNSKNIWIECTAPEKGKGKDGLPSLDYDSSWHDFPEKQILLRMTNAFDKKFLAYQRYVSTVVSDGDIFLIAMNVADLDAFDPGIPLIMKILFGMEYLQIPISPLGKSRKNISQPFWSTRSEVQKESGAPVSVKYFENDEYSGISAVIYSKTSVLNHSEKIGSDCILVHNPKAKNPLPLGIFPFFDEYQNQGDKIVKL